MNPVVKKIQKLLALSQSPNENEAASAMQKVQILLAENNLSIKDIKDDDTTIIEKYIPGWRRVELWRRLLHQAVESVTYTSTIYSTGRKRMIIVGREANIITAINLHEYLSNAILRYSRKMARLGYNRNSVRIGMVVRISERLEELKDIENDDSEKAIILHATANAKRENTSFIKSTHGELERLGRIKPEIDKESFSKGKQAGDVISLNDQIGSNNTACIES